MDIKRARAKYHSQKNGAKMRGIGWELTFREWLDWWGEDLDRRGTGSDQLQMQRKLDQGPYKLGNIVKGHPRQNVRTWVNVRLAKRSEIDAQRCQEAIDAAEVDWGAETPEPEDESIAAYFARGYNDDIVMRRCKADVLSGK